MSLHTRRKSSLGTFALLLVGTVSLLALGHDAGAVAGAPRLPNLNFADFGLASVPVVNPITPHSFAPLHDNLYHIVSQPGIIGNTAAPASKGSAPAWDGQGSLPDPFVSPWHFSQTRFDPTFRTPYWNERDGFTSNSFLLSPADTLWGRTVYQSGLAYVGKPDLSSVLPVFNNDDGAATRALFPNAPSAGVAL